MKSGSLASRTGWWLFATGLMLYLVLSAQALLVLGVPYDAPWGPMIVKLHPGTWFLLAGFVTLLASCGHPLRVAGGQLAAQPAIATYAGGIVLTLFYSAGRYGPSGAAFVIDTLITPALCALTVLMLDRERRHACLRILLSVTVANTLLGIGESVFHTHLVPLHDVTQAGIASDVFRPSALFGHPTTNALITTTLLPAAIYLRLSTNWRCALVLLLWAGSLVFGGRTSFALATLVYGAWFGRQLVVGNLRGHLDRRQASAGVAIGLVAVALLVETMPANGFAALVRDMLDSSIWAHDRLGGIARQLSREDLWFGMAPAALSGLADRGAALGNSWLRMFLQLGIVGFVPFVLAAVSAMRWLWKASNGVMRLSVLQFFVSVSSNDSLASKTIVLMLLFLVVALTRRMTVPGQIRSRDTAQAFPGFPTGSPTFTYRRFPE